MTTKEEVEVMVELFYKIAKEPDTIDWKDFCDSAFAGANKDKIRLPHGVEQNQNKGPPLT
jgi:hypothetical protein